MTTPPVDAVRTPLDLWTSLVLSVEEDTCEVWKDGVVSRVRFAPIFPGPRVERVSPGHLVAIAPGSDGAGVVVWRWYDAVVLGPTGDDSVRLWEPAHGEVVARGRVGYQAQDPGSRAWASAGLPGADWWVAGPAGAPAPRIVDLDEVARFYTEHSLWAAALDVIP